MSRPNPGSLSLSDVSDAPMLRSQWARGKQNRVRGFVGGWGSVRPGYGRTGNRLHVFEQPRQSLKGCYRTLGANPLALLTRDGNPKILTLFNFTGSLYTLIEKFGSLLSFSIFGSSGGS